MLLWANILVWVVVAMVVAPIVFPVPWLDNRPLFRGTPSKPFRWFLVAVFLVLALGFVIYQCTRHVTVN